MPTLGEIIKDKPVCWVSTNSSVFDVVGYMVQNNIGAVPVLEGNTLVGIFSERDLMNKCMSKGLDINSTKIDDVMTRDVISMEAANSYEDCLITMSKASIRHIPVRNGDKLIGVIPIRDLMQLDLDEKEQKIEILHSYIHYNPKG